MPRLTPRSLLVTSQAPSSSAAPIDNVVARSRSPRLLAWIAGLIWLIPLFLLAVAAWQTWRLDISERGAEVQNVLTILAEQTEQVFLAHTMALEWIDNRTQGWTWDDIEQSTELQDFIKGLDKGSNYFDAILLADGTGRVRMSEHHLPRANALKFVGDRGYFVSARDGASGVHFGRLEPGKRSGQPAFRVARRRSSADGRFDGIIAVRMAPRYFEEFFAKVVKSTASAITISRADGMILARHPAVPHEAPRLDNQPHFDLTTFRSPEPAIFTSALDGVERLGAVRKLGNYPIFVTYAVDMQVIRAGWLSQLKPFAIVALCSSLILALLAFYVQRIARGERAAQEAWRDEVRHRLRREMQVRQASKMEALGRLAGAIAHHFNNLLPAMSGLLEMTRTEVPSDSSAAKRLGRMIDAVDQGRDLVRRILTFSRRDAAHRDTIGVPTLIDDAIALAEGSLPANVQLLSRQDSAGALIGDASQLRDVLLNLISNAVHAIGTRAGTVAITTETFAVDSEMALQLGVHAGDFVRIDCSDDGVGMSKDIQERLFEPFFTTKPVNEGSGLGLAIVHGVVVGHGGAVEVHSSPGAGSRFSVYLPLARPD